MLSLSTILKINAVSSGTTGLVLILFAKPIADLFNVTATIPFVSVGVFLVLFALFVFSASSKNPADERVVKTIIVLDTLWVIASIIAIFMLTSIISFVGIFVIAAVALWVAAMAYLQKKGLQSIGSSTEPIKHLGIQ